MKVLKIGIAAAAIIVGLLILSGFELVPGVTWADSNGSSMMGTGGMHGMGSDNAADSKDNDGGKIICPMLKGQNSSCGSGSGCQGIKSSSTDPKDDADKSDGAQIYGCSMSSDSYLTLDKDAKCPSCGMKVEAVDQLYTCPMHHDFVTSYPKAKCPERGMNVVKTDELYVCPMHPDEISADPDAKCETCEMNLIPVKDYSPDMPIYACPMHPDQHSINPDDKCPICGMNFELLEGEK